MASPHVSTNGFVSLAESSEPRSRKRGRVKTYFMSVLNKKVTNFKLNLKVGMRGERVKVGIREGEGYFLQKQFMKSFNPYFSRNVLEGENLSLNFRIL